MKAKKLALCGLLTALALVLSYLESLVPLSFSVPGVKLGLPNLAILFALYKLGFKEAAVISLIAHYALKQHPVAASGIGVVVGAVIMVTGYTLGKIFVYSTFEYAMLKLPYEILQAAVGAVGGMLLCWKCGLVKVAKKHGIYFDPAEK